MEIWSVGGTYDTGSKEFLNVYGNVWYDGKSHILAFPQIFKEPPNVTANAVFAGGLGSISISRCVAQNFDFFIYHTREYTFSTTIKVNWSVRGRWK